MISLLESEKFADGRNILNFSVDPSTNGICKSAPKVACVNVIGISQNIFSPFLV